LYSIENHEIKRLGDCKLEIGKTARRNIYRASIQVKEVVILDALESGRLY
jgi:hypothetical protein